ncbi:cysteine protease ATG4-like isoform X1 [Cucumis melo var. makuwa]|uniref:Cysteine protease n=2 Tax=Cucumis melo TaxID=3656 RepID=A0A5A7SP82_CUCMM|nr:cysteine protease ATG4-like isoform X1 [Cucumis melo var. makuwa]TYK31630.1 cysteine protease ATG4-like isoform X1 [Cucumis melo var. makuwa]
MGRGKDLKSTCSSETTADVIDRTHRSVCSELGSKNHISSKASLWSGFFSSNFSICDHHKDSSVSEKKVFHSRHNVWATVRKVMTSGSMRRIQERILGSRRSGVYTSGGDIWLLGVCHKISQDHLPDDAASSTGVAGFEQDFSSRILMTYRKGFNVIQDSKYTSDVNWGCMLRSSQMLVSQALLFHRLGRSWRKPSQKPFDKEYVEILHLFGDSETSAFSIHNLLQAGRAYDLAAGSWVGPYAMCRSWETLVRSKRETPILQDQQLPMAIYIVSGDEDGERGGAPVLYIDDASRHCFEFSKGQHDWSPILLLVPLVLGLEKINPRYIPSLRTTFTFPQSLGILGGKPGASTYIVGVQDENAFYLDPHEVQQVVNIDKDDLEADTSSYHCNVIRHIPLESIDPSLAIGFYCRDKDDFDNFCYRASKLAEESDGAPLFTVAETHSTNSGRQSSALNDHSRLVEDDADGAVHMPNEEEAHEDDWQFL